jgi:hypothetical protein
MMVVVSANDHRGAEQSRGHTTRNCTLTDGYIHRSTFKGWAGISNAGEAAVKIKDKYCEHHELVRRVTPTDRLLEYRLGSSMRVSWEAYP